MILKLRHHFDSAHRLMDYDGKCNNIHGHTWKVNVTVYFNDNANKYITENKTSNGMIIDFKDIKDIINEFDHKLILREDDPLLMVVKDMVDVIILQQNATAEFLSKVITDKIWDMIDEKDIRKFINNVNIVIFESDNASIMYNGD